MYTGIICACLPCLRAFVKHFFPDSFLFRETTEERVTSLALSFVSAIPVQLRDFNTPQWTNNRRSMKTRLNSQDTNEVKFPDRVVVAKGIDIDALVP